MISSVIYNILFLITSVFVLLKVIGYGLYEWKEKENKTGGISVIVFSLAAVVFANLVLMGF